MRNVFLWPIQNGGQSEFIPGQRFKGKLHPETVFYSHIEILGMSSTIPALSLHFSDGAVISQ